MQSAQSNRARNSLSQYEYAALGAAILVQIFYYVSALKTHNLDYFFPWGSVHNTQGIDFYQVPNGAYAYLHGGSLTGQMATSAPSYSFGNVNVYHPFFTLVVGFFFQLFSPQVSFVLWTAIKLAVTIAVAAFLYRRFRGNKNLVFALCVFLAFFPQYLEIWNGQYHFILNIALLFLLLALMHHRNNYLSGILYFITLIVKPIGLLWIPSFLFKRQWRVLAVGLSLFAIVTLLFVVNRAGTYFISNLIDRTNNPIGGPPAVFTLDTLLRFFGMPLLDKGVKLIAVLALLVIEIRVRPNMFLSLFLWISYYLLFYDLVFEYHYTVLVPIFVLGVLTQPLFQQRLAKALIVISCLPTPFFLMHAFQFGASGHYVTNAGWITIVLWRIVPLMGLDVAIVAWAARDTVGLAAPFHLPYPAFWLKPVVAIDPALAAPPRSQATSRTRFRDRQPGWWLRIPRDNRGRRVSDGVATASAGGEGEPAQLDPGAPVPRRPRHRQVRRPRGVVGGLIVAAIILVAVVILHSAGVTSPSTPTATPVPTTVASTLASNLPVLNSCAPKEVNVGAPTRTHISLDTLPVLCGRVNLAAAGRATWHGLRLRRGLQFTGKNSAAVFALDGRYRSISGTIYLDNRTGTNGGIFDIYAATAPRGTETYHMLYELDIGMAPQNRTTFSVPVSGVRYMALVERCCTLQNTMLDVAATLSKT